jgi:hypothetical protein
MNYSKEYQVGQSSSMDASKKDYYQWAIWIESGESDISEIEYVEYLLHPTFKNRLRKVTNPADGFRLESAGWGEFLININITKKSGEVIQIGHWLSLGTESDDVMARGVVPSELKPKKVYISYSRIEERTAQLLESMLIDLGMEVSSGYDIEPGVSINEYIEESIKAADAVITINSDRENDWQKTEIKIAKSMDKTIIPMDKILDQSEDTSQVKSRFYSDEDYGNKLKAMGNKFTNLKF